MYRLRVIWGQSVTVRPQLHRPVNETLTTLTTVSPEKNVYSQTSWLLEVSESH